MEAFFQAHQTVIFMGLILVLIAVLTWLSVEVTMVYQSVAPILNSGLGQALART